MKYIYSILLLLCCISICNAAEPAEADSAYSNSNFAQAAELYESIAKQYGVNAELLCNMGNAYVKAGDYGHAMLDYKRALKLEPGNKVAKQNVNYLLSKIADNNRAELKGKKVSVDPDETSFLGSVRDALTLGVTTNTWALCAIIAFLLTIICVAGYLFFHNVLLRKFGFFGGLSLLACAAIFLILAFASNRAVNKQSEGVIIGYKVQLYAEPSTESKASANQLTRGTVMKILEQKEGDKSADTWYKVKLNSDFIGWLPADAFEVI
jgi:tetratricopeptide (TPR) repeat protein